MKKLLYTTSALVGAAFLMEAVAPAKAEVNVSLRYRAVLMSQSVDEDTKKAFDMDKLGANGQKQRSTNLTTAKINLGLSGSKDHPNGLTTSMTLSATTGGSETLTYDNAFGSIAGSFGKVDVGSVRNIGYRSQGYGVPGTSNFGAVDAGFNPSIPDGAGALGLSYINTSATYYVGGRASTIAYWSPSFSGAQLGVSWQPQSSYTGKASSFTSKQGDVEDALALSGTYSGSFGGTGVSMGVAFATADVVSERSPNFTGTPSDGATSLPDEVIDPLPKTGLHVVNTGDGNVGSITSGVSVATTKDQDPTAYSGYISFDIDSFSVGGSYGSWETASANSTTTSEFTAYALGASYSIDALTFGISWATRDEERTHHNIRTVSSASAVTSADTINKSAAYKRDIKSTTLSFTTAYQLGDGAAIDFVMERSDAEVKEDVLYHKGEGDATGFGVGIDLKF